MIGHINGHRLSHADVGMVSGQLNLVGILRTIDVML